MNARMIAATALVEQAHTWPVVTLKRPHGAIPAGTIFYGVPSSKGDRCWMANERACNCPDSIQRMIECKHSKAVKLYTERQGLATDAEVDAMMAEQSGHKSYWLDIDDQERIDRAVARTRAELAARGAAA